MNEVIKIRLSEQVQLDQGRLGLLYTQLGDAGAESVVCRAMEELAVRLSQCETLWRNNNQTQLRKHARSLIAISDQIGMDKLAQISSDVTHAIDAQDDVAIAATLSRLLRIGEKSLAAIWIMDDLSL
ncbi:hypothetical protein [Sulfitobacter donghicola]|uniref:Uncharacterized protein n=1 Tax=Sulfitobacter donghicola DSW-25 = KCTC 12864 = JCM 14565 TaxID=1300350 RepID=A0A073IJH0_9RHOB|nr:hypothetical protein [Sulfitobacter donghicola]KEJ90458.1 hypothetical protein DSW25_00635 [Sulfitobacter donghicola DSW-25 = KCTC 12864 = JCM 14565]KIN67695.1 hypothetical protein Z948_1417 [Sulfitobacter donghicola DSW-25 = KCTC 12864 = JCM 14565]